MRSKIVLSLVAAASTMVQADEAPLRPDQTAYLDLYKEFVEANTPSRPAAALSWPGKSRLT